MPKRRKSDGRPCGTLDRKPKNENEAQAYEELHSKGFLTVTKRGMPDFFALKPDGSFCLCEVKQSNQSLSKPQFLLFKKLSALGVPCYYYSPKLGLRKFRDLKEYKKK